MRAIKALGIVALVYIGVVIVFESGLILGQPEFDDTFVITTMDKDGAKNDRVLVRNMSGGKLYASVNHWPRGWYHEALANPNVQVTIDGISGEYQAVPVDGSEYKQVEADNPSGHGFRALTGFAPRRLLRLDPKN